MQHISDTNNSYSNSIKTKKTIAIAIAIDDKKVDWLLDQNQDLIPDSYRSWHAKFIKQNGDELWIRCAKTARQEGKAPQRYFVWLLKRHGVAV